MANLVSILAYTNTFSDQMVAVNALAKENNDIAANNYTKTSGTLILNDYTLALQVNSKAIFANTLSVSGIGSSASIQNSLTVAGQALFTNTTLSMTTSGQANVGGQLLAIGSGTGLYVANNAVVNGTLQVNGQFSPAGSVAVGGVFYSTGQINANTTLNVAGATTLNTLNVTGATTVAGLTVSGTLTASGSGLTGTASGFTAGNVVNGLYSSVSYSNPTWLTSVSGSIVSGNITGNANNITSYTINQNLAVTSNVQHMSIGVGTAPDSANTGSIRAINSVTSYYSDDRLKTRFGNIPDALAKVAQLNGFYYQANDVAQALGYNPKREVGLSAQEVNSVLPEIVTAAPISDKYMTIYYERVVPLLVEAIKELKREVDILKNG